MFVIELIYKVPLAQVDQHMKEHVAFLNKHYEAGNFLISGRKIPRAGGVIIALGESAAELERVMQQDPFVAKGVAEFRIIEFRASQRASDIPTRIV